MTDNPGGVESFIINYCKELCGKIDFDFLTYNVKPAYFDTIKSMGANVYTVTGKRENLFKNRKQLKQFFDKRGKDYDVIWLNLCELSSIEPLIFAKKSGIKKRIVHSHNTQNMSSRLASLLHKFNKKQIAKYATDFWACSKEAGDFFFSDVPVKKVVIINNAVNVEKFKYNSEQRKKYREMLDMSNRLVIGHVGRMHRQKNPFFVLDIFAKILTLQANAVLLWVGTGELFSDIKKKAIELGIDKSIIFAGARKDVNDLMQSMDVFLLPSLYEGFPVVLVEAQASGLPCLVSNTVTEQVKILESCRMLDLKDGADLWAESAINVGSMSVRRQEEWEKVQKAGYDIKQEAEKLVYLLEDETYEKKGGLK